MSSERRNGEDVARPLYSPLSLEILNATISDDLTNLRTHQREIRRRCCPIICDQPPGTWAFDLRSGVIAPSKVLAVFLSYENGLVICLSRLSDRCRNLDQSFRSASQSAVCLVRRSTPFQVKSGLRHCGVGRDQECF